MMPGDGQWAPCRFAVFHMAREVPSCFRRTRVMRFTVPQEQHAQRLLQRACARCLLAGLALAATLILISSAAFPYTVEAAPPMVAHRTLTTGLARTDALTSTAADVFMHALM